MYLVNTEWLVLQLTVVVVTLCVVTFTTLHTLHPNLCSNISLLSSVTEKFYYMQQ